MSEFVIMPKSDYEAACNSIRAKTGKTDLIKSGAMSAEIESITVGGGSSADVRYVTFMSYDGSVEYGKIPVAVGYDCPNPKFDDPTRESTAQYNYTFYGWATTLNGGADANWYKSITEDKTVYANFTATVRYYTITYYDGDTVLKMESLAYGVTPEYAPKKTGYDFLGWEPKIASVVGNAEYYAQWKALTGFSEVAMVSIGDLPTSSTSIAARDVAINNAGNRLAFALSDNRNDGKYEPAVYNIGGDTPVLLYCENACGNAAHVEFNFKNVLHVRSFAGATYYIATYNTDNESSFELLSRTTSNTTSSGLACSPVSDITGYYYYQSGSKYYLGSATVTPQGSIKNAAFSPDGEHIALVSTSNGTRVYTIDGTLVADTGTFGSTKTNLVSYNADGSLMAVSYSVSPYVSIYETTNYTKLFDLSDVLAAGSYAQFLGDDTLVIGSGTEVIVRTVTASGATEFEYPVPTYDGGTIVDVVKNHNGTRVVLKRADSVVVWAKL